MGRDRRHASPRARRRGRWLAPTLTVVLALLLLVAGGATAYRLGWVAGWLDQDRAAAPSVPPEVWESPVPSPSAVAAPARTSGVDPAKVGAALAGPLRDADLGRHVLAQVAPLDGGDPVFSKGRGAAVPASTTKLLTALAALDVLGPEATFATKVLQPSAGAVVLVGGGDPLLGAEPAKDLYPDRADLGTLAADTAVTLRKAGVAAVRLGFDDSLFTGPATSPHWPPSYVPDDVVSPVSALWADQGRTADGEREPDPAAAAAAVFAGELRAHGVKVRGPVRRTAGHGTELAQVTSAPVREIVQHTLETSDNDAAEVLARHVGVVVGGGGSFEGGVAGVAATLANLGVPTDGLQLYDGSGLSREDRIAPATLAGVLQAAAADPALSAVLGGLPVAGFSGSLVERFEDAAAAPGLGVVRAKTGTLTGVHALAGVVTDLDGDAMVMVLMTDRVTPPKTLDARQALDDAAAALAGCHCAS